MFFGGATAERRRQLAGVGAEGAQHRVSVAIVADLDKIDTPREAGVIVATPTRDLTTFNRRQGGGIRSVDRLGSALQRTGKGNIHPFLKVRPSGEVFVHLL